MNKTYELLIDTINSLPGIEITTTVISSAHIFDKEFLDIRTKWNGIFLFFHSNQLDSEGLFFLTRCLDRRYFQHGHKWRIELSVSDRKYDNGDRPIAYQIYRPFLDGDTEEIILSECEDLIENLAYHFNHDGFMIGFDMDKTKYKQSRLHWTKEAWGRETQLNDLGI